MEECREFETLIDRKWAGEATPAERERLAAHLEVCAACAELSDVLDGVAAEPELEAPSEEELAALRRRVLANLRAVPAASPRAGAPASARRLAWAAALAGVAFLAGWMAARGGRTSAVPVALVAGGDAAPSSAALASQIRAAALEHGRFEDVENSPYVFSGVRVERVSAGRVHLSFDVARHLDLELDRRDPLLAEVLVQAVTGPSTVGSRIAAIDVARSLPDERLERALVVAVRHDDNLGVRFRALESLASAAREPEVESALLEVLAHDPDVSMRLAAVDALTRARVAPERLERALASGGNSDSETAVRSRAASYLAANDVPSRGEQR
jgi:hypothetical protein